MLWTSEVPKFPRLGWQSSACCMAIADNVRRAISSCSATAGLLVTSVVTGEENGVQVIKHRWSFGLYDIRTIINPGCMGEFTGVNYDVVHRISRVNLLIVFRLSGREGQHISRQRSWAFHQLRWRPLVGSGMYYQSYHTSIFLHDANVPVSRVIRKKYTWCLLKSNADS